MRGTLSYSGAGPGRGNAPWAGGKVALPSSDLTRATQTACGNTSIRYLELPSRRRGVRAVGYGPAGGSGVRNVHNGTGRNGEHAHHTCEQNESTVGCCLLLLSITCFTWRIDSLKSLLGFKSSKAFLDSCSHVVRISQTGNSLDIHPLATAADACAQQKCYTEVARVLSNTCYYTGSTPPNVRAIVEKNKGSDIRKITGSAINQAIVTGEEIDLYTSTFQNQ